MYTYFVHILCDYSYSYIVYKISKYLWMEFVRPSCKVFLNKKQNINQRSSPVKENFINRTDIEIEKSLLTKLEFRMIRNFGVILLTDLMPVLKLDCCKMATC